MNSLNVPYPYPILYCILKKALPLVEVVSIVQRGHYTSGKVVLLPFDPRDKMSACFKIFWR